MVSPRLNLLAFLAFLVALLDAVPVTAIAGGQDAQLGWFPYTVNVRYRHHFSCGGIIVGNLSILTAAHCVHGLNAEDVTIVAGTVTLDSGGTTYQVSAIHAHPRWNTSTLQNDIAVLKLASPISYDPYIRPIALTMDDPPPGSGTIGSGWGITSSNGNVSNILQWISLQELDRTTCQEKYPYFPVTIGHICTTSTGKGGMCRGDSGGPLTDERATLVGVYSWGHGCGEGEPDVYASVAYHRDWIRGRMV